MSRKTKTKNRYEARRDKIIAGAKVTAPVTAAPLTQAQKAEIAKPIMPDIMQAMDFAEQVGKTTGFVRGLRRGIEAPRSPGERIAKSLGPTIDLMLAAVKAELMRAYTKFPRKQASPHEGYAVLIEETDELWDEIKADRGRMSTATKEAIQVAAMGVRYAIDNC